MAVSTNLHYMKGVANLRKRLLQLLNASFGQRAFVKKLCYKAGVPGATDTPVAKGDICVDTTNNHAYVNTTYDAGGASNVWTQIA